MINIRNFGSNFGIVYYKIASNFQDSVIISSYFYSSFFISEVLNCDLVKEF